MLLAAGTPAKRAAKVPPVAAVAGIDEYRKDAKVVYFPAHPRLLKIETALGIRHAVSAKKNLFLMTGSFALSIILFLSFSVLIDFAGCLMPQSAVESDIDISGIEAGNTLSSELIETIRKLDGVKQIYGRRICSDVPALPEAADSASQDLSSSSSCRADLISFDDFDLQCLKKDGMLRRGSSLSKVYGDSRYVLATWDQYSPWKIGDKIRIGEDELEIAGLLNYDPFSEDGLTGGISTLPAHIRHSWPAYMDF